MKLLMARSLAGHDKGELYVVVCEEDKDVILVNGNNRTMDKPKRKRKSHVQPIVHFPSEISQMAEKEERWNDDNVRKLIKTYCLIVEGNRRKESVKSGCN